MTKKKQNTQNKRTAAIEWIGALAPAPAAVAGAPHHAELVFWLDADRKVVGMTVAVEPGEALRAAVSSFDEAIARPLVGRPHAPTRVRTESPALADAIRAAHPEIDLVVAPTPETVALFAALGESLGTPAELDDDLDDDDLDGHDSYLATGLDPADVAAFFDAAAELQRASLWEVVPDGAPAFGFSIEALGIESGSVTLTSHFVKHTELTIFERIDEHHAHVNAVEVLETGDRFALPPHCALEIEPAAAVSAQLRAEIAEHGWVLASPDAIPTFYCVDSGRLRELTPHDLHMAEALARALPIALRGAGDALQAAWTGESAWAHRCAVPTRAGDVEVELRLDGRFVAQSEGEAPEAEASDGGLVQAFARSPEAAALESWGYLPILQDLAATYVGPGLDDLDASDLRELLFEIVPRKISMEPSEAGPLMAELRAFYSYLERTRGTPILAARVLSEDAMPGLEAALADPTKFGLAKSLVMGSDTTGYDMDTREGVEAWMHAMNARLELPAPRHTPPRSQAAKAKAKRKAARKARKKNR